MQCQHVNYVITGDEMQAVEIRLNPGETIIAEAGTMNYMDDAIRFEAKTGDGVSLDNGLLNKLVGAGKRLLTGQSLFMTHFTNTSDGIRCACFSTPCPGKILALDLSLLGNELLCQKDAFLCAAPGTQISLAFTRRIGTGFFGGDGFILHRLEGDGLVFLHPGGAVVEKELKEEVLLVDTGCIVAFTAGIEYNIQQADKLKSMFFGSRGQALVSLSGTGKVYLQTLPLARLADRVLQNGAVTDRQASQDI